MSTDLPPDLIYLDYNATTPVDPRVAAAMEPYLLRFFGNPSSGHAQGQATRRGVDQARRQAASLLGVEPVGVVFTSGGTESNNHALHGAARAAGPGSHLITTAVEHPAIGEVCARLESDGHPVTVVPVDGLGRVDPDDIRRAIRPGTALISVMHANNEVGTIQPLADIARIAREHGVLLHSDCAQSVGKIPVTLDGLGCDLISVAGHKLYGPKGVGLLCLRPGLTLPNLMQGAGHEQGRRPGTENILGLSGLGEACRLAGEELEQEMPRLADLRDRIETELLEAFPTARVHGDRAPGGRLPNTSSIGFEGCRAAEILACLEGVAVSAGAACHGADAIGSAVLRAMGVEPRFAAGTLRISVGRMTTPEEVDAAVPRLVDAVRGAS